MERLPREIALDILARLPITSLQRLKSVNKAWFSLAQDPNLPLINHAQNPCLILHCDQALLQDQLYLIDTDLHHFDTSVLKLNLPFKSVMPNFEISGSCNGLLCLSDSQSPDNLQIYNPLTHQSTQLPPPNKNFSNQRVVLGFGFHPTTKEFKLIRTVYCLPPRKMMGVFGYIGYGSSDTSIYTLGTDSIWRSLGKAAYWLDGRSPTALVNGVLHWLTQCHKYKQFQDIVSFDLDSEKFDKVPGPSCESFKRNWYSLAELRGCLSAVVRTSYYGGVEVWVKKDYNAVESWTKEFVIRAYSPVGFNPDIELSERMQEKRFWKRPVRVVYGLRTGEILLEYGNQALVCYDPVKDEFKDLHFDGLPNCFESVALMGSLVSLQGGI